MKKRILAAVLAMLLVFGFTTVSAWAANVSDESSLLTELSAGGTAVLDQNITITQKVTVSQNVTLDLNGFTLTLVNKNIDIPAGASLTIVDSSSGQSGTISGGGSININGTLNLQSGKILVEVYNKSGGQFYITSGDCSELYNEGTLHANGGAISSRTENYGTITVDTGCTPTVFGNDVRNLSGGQIAGGTFDKYVSQEDEDAVISGGTFNGIVMGMDGQITGGTFNNKVCTIYKVGATVSGGIFYGATQLKASKILDSAYITVSFSVEGGPDVAEQKIVRGTTAGKPELNKLGFIFKGWHKDAALIEEYDFDTPVISNITLYGKMIECDHTGNTNALSCTEDTICSVCSGTIKAAHSLSWKADATHYWQECIREGCDYTTVNNKKEIPTIEIKGKDKVHTDQDYSFSFELPEDSTVVRVECAIPLIGPSDLKVNMTDGIYTGVVSKDNYAGAESFKIIVTVEINDGYTVEVTKKVMLADEHEGGTATCKEQATCTICGEAYGEKSPNNHANLKQFPAKAATVAEEGNKEYWYCDGCKKYFSDENAENEINSADTVIAKLAPSIISGDGQTVTEGDKKALEFTSDAAFEDFISVEIDSKTIDESNYTVKSGSIVVTLNADYVATLSAGEHTLGIVSQSGTATAKFTVNEKVEETTTTTDKPTTNDETKSPKTGDNSNIFLWLALLFVSCGAVSATTIAGRKRKYNR